MEVYYYSGSCILMENTILNFVIFSKKYDLETNLRGHIYKYCIIYEHFPKSVLKLIYMSWSWRYDQFYWFNKTDT